MASPWKFLKQLVSPRREQKQPNGTIDTVTPETLAIAGPTETPAEESLSSAGLPAGGEQHSHNQTDVVSAEPDKLEETGSDLPSRLDIEDDKVVGAADPASSDHTDIVIAPHEDAKLEPAAAGIAHRPKGRGRKAEAAVAVSQVSPVVHTASDEAIILDEEIRVLRRQLQDKLQLQNAQLKKMLERFQS
jgi:hypothetical protein